MNLIISKFTALKIGWNQKPLAEGVFYQLCHREKVRPIEIPLLVPGFYMVCGGKRYIYTDSRLRGLRWLHTAFHELAHPIYTHPPQLPLPIFSS